MPGDAANIPGVTDCVGVDVAQTTEISVVLVKCTRCELEKPVTEFRADPRKTNGLRSHCRACDRLYARIRQRETEQSVLWRKANPEAAYQIDRAANLRRHYGITVAEYDALLAAQGGKCAVCRSPDPRGRKGATRYFFVDHCHVTGAVRGLLCMPCNAGIGNLGDDPEVVGAALAYLLAHKI